MRQVGVMRLLACRLDTMIDPAGGRPCNARRLGEGLKTFPVITLGQEKVEDNICLFFALSSAISSSQFLGKKSLNSGFKNPGVSNGFGRLPPHG